MTHTTLQENSVQNPLAADGGRGRAKNFWTKVVDLPVGFLRITWQQMRWSRTLIDGLFQPKNNFTAAGYEVIPNVIEREECERLIKVTDSYLRDQSYSIKGNCYLVNRRDVKNINLKMQQIINAQEIDEGLKDLFDSGIIEKHFEARTGEKLKLQSFVIQVDNVDSSSKRGYHVDRIIPPLYKAFIYLNDVDVMGDGPYTVIPKSHRHFFRRIINAYYNWISFTKLDAEARRRADILGNMNLFYEDSQAVSFLGKAGTTILSNQLLSHKGWHQHDHKVRYALICVLTPERHWDGQIFNLYGNSSDKALN